MYNTFVNEIFLLIIVLLSPANPQRQARPQEAPKRKLPPNMRHPDYPHNIRPPQFAPPRSLRPQPYHGGHFQPVEGTHPNGIPPPPGHPFEGSLHYDAPNQLNISPNPPRVRASVKSPEYFPRKGRMPQMVKPAYKPIPWANLQDRPVIGILTQASKVHVQNYGNDYVRKEYIKFLEMAGAYVTLVRSGQPLDYYTDIFLKINGLFLPGGGADLRNSTFSKTIRIFLDLATNANDKGDYFPIWGTCLGFEIMVIQAAKMYAFNQTDSTNMSLPLTLTPSYKTTRMLGNAPQEIIDYLTQENTTANFHIMSLLTETYNKVESLNKFYRIVSTNKGRDEQDFVSTIEAYNYPFFAVQWHPEKPIFVRKPDLDIPTSDHAIKIGQYFANFFISEARKSNHSFPSDEERARAVVGDEDPYCLPKELLENICAACSCCVKEPDNSKSSDLCLAAVSTLCIALFVLYVWPTLYLFPTSKEISFDKGK